MMMENKKTVFEDWLNEYGSRLEELAAARLRGPEQDASSPDPADGSRAANDIVSQRH